MQQQFAAYLPIIDSSGAARRASAGGVRRVCRFEAVGVLIGAVRDI